jgi:hypothetical protein
VATNSSHSRTACDDGSPGRPADQRDRFATVSQQALVHRPPAPGRRGVERIEQTAANLPAHERQRRPSERQVTRRAARRPVVGPGDQRKTRSWIVARRRDLRLSPGERVSVFAHPRLEHGSSGMTRSSAHPEVSVQLVCVCPVECRRVLLQPFEERDSPECRLVRDQQPGGQAADLVGGEDYIAHNNAPCDKAATAAGGACKIGVPPKASRTARTRRVLEHKARRRIDWNRIAITEEQIAQRGLTPILKKDHRFTTEPGRAREHGIARPPARAPSNASSGMAWTACYPNRSATFWSVRLSSGPGSPRSSTARRLRYEHGRDS